MNAFPNLFAALVLDGLVGFFVRAAVPTVTYPVFNLDLESESHSTGVTPEKTIYQSVPSARGIRVRNFQKIVAWGRLSNLLKRKRFVMNLKAG
jgi:hypothetical protein